MTPASKALLRALAAGPARTAELAHRAGVSRSTATGVLMRLERERRVRTWAFTTNYGDHVVRRMWQLGDRRASAAEAKTIARLQKQTGSKYHCLCARHFRAANRPMIDQGLRMRRGKRDVCFVCKAAARYEFHPNFWERIERSRSDRRPPVSQQDVVRRLVRTAVRRHNKRYGK